MCSMLSHHFTPITTTALPHWSDMLIPVQSSSSFTVRIGWPIQLSKTFSCLFLLSFMLTLPLHEVMIPLFFVFFFSIFFHKWILPFSLFFSSPFYPTYLSPFLFSWFVCFLTTASWNRSGWHPRSLTGQCTSHIPLLLYFSDSCPYSCFSSYLLGFFSHTHSVRSLTASHLISPLHIPLFPHVTTVHSLSPSLSTHSILFQTTISSNLI